MQASYGAAPFFAASPSTIFCRFAPAISIVASWLLAFRNGTIAKSLASLLTERLLDLAALTIVLIVLFLFFPTLDSNRSRSRLLPFSFLASPC